MVNKFKLVVDPFKKLDVSKAVSKAVEVDSCKKLNVLKVAKQDMPMSFVLDLNVATK